MDDEIITITKSITITTDWQDTGIKGNDIPGFGTYAVQFCGGDPTISIWGDYFSGIMSWYNGGTNGGRFIVLVMLEMVNYFILEHCVIVEAVMI